MRTIAIAALILSLAMPGCGRAAGTTGIIVNGQALSPQTLRQLQQIYPVPIAPGRYWVTAQGVGGFESLPASFNLALCGGGGGGGSNTRTYCDANGACISSGILGTITTAPY